MSRLTVTRPSLARLATVAVSAAAALASLPAPDAAAQETVCKGRAVTIMGTTGHDRINGTAGTDVISTGPGDDLVNAGGGNDYVCTGDGDDRIEGGAGSDVFAAGNGNDACSNSSDLRIGCEAGMATTFMPSRHGFPFVNHFTGIPTIVTPFGTVNGVDYGLCGGMAFAARDHWILDKNAPGNGTTPQSGVVFDYMWQRLVDSLTIDFSWNLFRFNELQQKSTTSLNASNVTETTAIKSALASGPVPVGLIIPSASGPIWANHQVLAIGWFTDPANGNTVVKLYDPNFPDQMTYLDTTAKTLRPVSATVASPIRGWFKEKVDFKAPTY